VISEYFDNNFDLLITQEDSEMILLWKERIQLLKAISTALLLLEKYSITLRFVFLFLFPSFFFFVLLFFASSLRNFNSQNIFLTPNYKCKLKGEYEILPFFTTHASSSSNELRNELIVSFGRIIFQLITGKKEMPHQVNSNPNAVRTYDGCPEQLKSLMYHCLNSASSHSSSASSSFTITVNDIWKKLDEIWNHSFPFENQISNHLLRKNSLSLKSHDHLGVVGEVKNMKLNPFDDESTTDNHSYQNDLQSTQRHSFQSVK
jgi:hypothetical protein